MKTGLAQLKTKPGIVEKWFPFVFYGKLDRF
jgi:hypothetical protein